MMPPSQEPPTRSPVPLLRISLPILAVILLVNSAWLCDDAYISFRTLSNFLSGHGLTWNTAERVQVYTHPLWLLLNAGLVALTGHVEFTVLAISAALTLLTLWLVYRHVAHTELAGVAAVFVLLLSKSFVDFSISGLENPLTRLLLVLFAWLWLRSGASTEASGEAARSSGELTGLCLLTALAVLCRPDAMLLCLPALLVATREVPPRLALRSLITGFAPLALWAGFALFYYGTPLPNTAYAKLGLAIARWRIVGQGFVYLLDSLLRDPLTLLTVAFASWAVLRRRRARGPLALMVGAWLHLAFIVWIGGDFMSGRFLDGAFLLAVLVLAGQPMPKIVSRHQLVVAAAALVCLLPRLVVPFLVHEMVPWKVVDERSFYYPSTGLVPGLWQARWPDHHWRQRGEQLAADGETVAAKKSVGMLGYFAGPDVLIVDEYGITDPLLARLPGQGAPPSPGGYFGWRPGHSLRHMPRGYIEGLREGRNGIEDPDLAAYYDIVRFVTRGDLWDIERLKTVIRWQFGIYDHSLESYVERLPAVSEAPEAPDEPDEP